MKKLMWFFLSVSILTSHAIAFTECQMAPRNVWSALDGSNIWVCFDKDNCVYKELGGSVTESHLNRMYTAALTAINAQKTLTIRYTATLDCNALNATSKTNQIEGFWLNR